MTTDPTITWDILSVLAAAPLDGDPPFFAQREAAKQKTDDASDGEVEVGEALFVEACPLRDSGCFPALYSREAICNEFTNILMLHGGRMSSMELGTWLGMEEDDVARVGEWLCREDGEPSTKRRACMILNPATQQHDYALVESLRARLRERMEWHCGSSSSSDDEYIPSLDELARSSQGGEWAPIATVATKQLARELDLTIEDVAWLLEEELGSADASSTFTVVRSKSGVPEKVFNQGVADRYRYLERQLASALSGVTAPTSLEKLLGRDFGGEESAATIISSVQSLSESGEIYGTLSVPLQQASSANAIYTPHIYSRGQRKIADSFYRNNGYLTTKKCIALGVSRNRIEDFVKESFPNAVLLTQSIIDLDAICRPLEIAVQSAILNKTFVDLRTHVPADIASREEDTKAIVDVNLAALLREQQMHDSFAEGLKIVNGDMALFFSREMVDDCKALLPSLVEDYSKQRAKQIAGRESGGENDLIPLASVAEAVGKKYPDLLTLQHEQGHNFDTNDAISWSNDAGNDGPLVEFCRCAIFSSELQRMCARSVKAELSQLNDTQHGVSVSSQAAAKIANIGDSFEASFRTLCHLLQLFSKSLDAIASRAQQSSEGESIEQMVDEMKRELLLGCGSCLARLITEYYSFKHEGETESRLFFESCEEAGNATAAVDGIDLATMNFPRYELKCRKDDSGKPQSDPLKYLRSAYAGSPGLSLSQMWSLCSSDDGSNSEAGKKLKAFVELLGENCLTLVGVPFSVLDKKTEKKVLTARREGLLERLDKSQDNEEMARCAAILIYQQVKSLPIAGVDTANAVTRLFEHDKKIPPEVTQDLLTLRTCDDSDAPMCLILRVKKYGSAKNAKALASLVDKEQH